METITIFDTTLRDGEQAAGAGFAPAHKLAIARKLEELGVDVVEAGFAAASEAEVSNIDAIARALRHARVCSLSRANAHDVAASARALEHARNPRLHVFINSSDVQIRHQLRATREEVIARAVRAVEDARRHVDDVEFSAMDATRADPAFLAELVRAVLAAGARTINVPDTVGIALPCQVRELIEGLFVAVPELRNAIVSFHGQDDLGLSVANSLAAIRAGARQLELTVNGIGERAGNTSLEEVVVALRVHGERLGARTNVRTEGLYELSEIVERHSGLAVPANKAIVGKNAFRHASGIHQDGVLKERTTFEAIDPAWIGHPRGSEIVLGKLSGRAGFAAKTRALGYALAATELAHAYDAFQALADAKLVVEDDEVRALCEQSVAALSA